MSSLEIAELTGKRHADVMRDIRVTFSQIAEFGDDANMRFLIKQGVTVALISAAN